MKNRICLLSAYLTQTLLCISSTKWLTWASVLSHLKCSKSRNILQFAMFRRTSWRDVRLPKSCDISSKEISMPLKTILYRNTWQVTSRVLTRFSQYTTSLRTISQSLHPRTSLQFLSQQPSKRSTPRLPMLWLKSLHQILTPNWQRVF